MLTENIVWQHIPHMLHCEPRLPCDTTQLGRFRAALGEAGAETPPQTTIDTAVPSKATYPTEMERLIPDNQMQAKAITRPVDWRLPEIAHQSVALHT